MVLGGNATECIPKYMCLPLKEIPCSKMLRQTSRCKIGLANATRPLNSVVATRSARLTRSQFLDVFQCLAAKDIGVCKVKERE
ncbi:hypothetical protein SAMN06265222_107218 [Neorhodopirellula lusitana]|uniref:Uncharacterized protein n=1 Tax=Neorhodopirellula lusitana TaxID=445327 RepID=A0ABY1QAU6_9BACT|nr:hypothetical protein SAMN06265222_107218 [Neorhodopirellula lusitana]